MLKVFLTGLFPGLFIRWVFFIYYRALFRIIRVSPYGGDFRKALFENVLKVFLTGLFPGLFIWWDFFVLKKGHLDCSYT